MEGFDSSKIGVYGENPSLVCGASSSIWGVFTYHIGTWLLNCRDMKYKKTRWITMLLAVWFLLFDFLNDAYGNRYTRIAHWAHGGGWFAGFIGALIMSYNLNPHFKDIVLSLTWYLIWVCTIPVYWIFNQRNVWVLAAMQ